MQLESLSRKNLKAWFFGLWNTTSTTSSSLYFFVTLIRLVHEIEMSSGDCFPFLLIGSVNQYCASNQAKYMQIHGKMWQYRRGMQSPSQVKDILKRKQCVVSIINVWYCLSQMTFLAIHKNYPLKRSVMPFLRPNPQEVQYSLAQNYPYLQDGMCPRNIDPMKESIFWKGSRLLKWATWEP